MCNAEDYSIRVDRSFLLFVLQPFTFFCLYSVKLVAEDMNWVINIERNQAIIDAEQRIFQKAIPCTMVWIYQYALNLRSQKWFWFLWNKHKLYWGIITENFRFLSGSNFKGTSRWNCNRILFNELHSVYLLMHHYHRIFLKFDLSEIKPGSIRRV